MGPAFPHVCVQGGRHLLGCRGGCSIAHTPPGFCHELNVCVRKTLEELQLASGTWGGKISGVRVLTSAGKEWQKKVGRSWRCSWLGEIAVCGGGVGGSDHGFPLEEEESGNPATWSPSPALSSWPTARRLLCATRQGVFSPNIFLVHT